MNNKDNQEKSVASKKRKEEQVDETPGSTRIEIKSDEDELAEESRIAGDAEDDVEDDVKGDGADDASEEDGPEDIDKVKLEVKENYDKYLRVCAEFDNYKKRAAREVSDFRKYANE